MDIFYLQLTGIKICGLCREPKSRLLRNLLTIYRFILLVFLFYHLIMYIFFIIENIDDFMEIALSVTSLGVDIISVTKVLTFWYYLDRFYDLLEKIQENSSKSEHVKKANQTGALFTKAFFIQLLIASTLYNFTPLSMNLYNYLRYGSEWTTEMPLKFKIFYDVSKSPAYEITYAVTVLNIYTISFICCAADTMFLVCCLNIGAYFDALKDKFHETDKKSFIKEHQEALKIASEFNELYRIVIFVEFLIISIVLCGIGVTFVMARNLVEQLLVIAYGNAMLFQLFFYCYSGEKLMNKTASVCEDIYELDRDYCLVIKRIQKKIIVQAPFFKATLEQFASVLNMTWSLITVLKSSME